MRMLLEANRQALLAKSRASKKGRERYNRRKRSTVLNSTREINNINMNELFKDDILTVSIVVRGETDTYEVKVKFGGFLKKLRSLADTEDEVDIRNITRALVHAFNSDDAYVHCSCPDYTFRYNYWNSRNNVDSGPLQRDNGKWIRNPDDSLGSGCKHVLLVISNERWLQTVARVIFNYIQYIKKHREALYARIIYPAIFNKKYEEPTQMDMFDTDDTLDKAEIKTANDERRDSTKFKKGNQSGVQFASDKMDKAQLDLFDEENPEEDND